MARHRITRGLDVPITGAPVQTIVEGPRTSRVAMMADDFPGLRPRMRVAVGDQVRRGQVLCEDAAIPGIRHTATAAGRVIAIHRGARRALRSIVIELSQSERAGEPGDEAFVELATFPSGAPEYLDRTEIRALLIESGLWTAFRTRPFSKVPRPETTPTAIFVTALDTNPLAAKPEVVLAQQREDFDLGLELIARLTDGPTYLCVRPGSGVETGLKAPVTTEEFDGPHPAGTAGLHIHVLAPVSRGRTVWTVGYQDVASIGRLFRRGRLDVRRVIAIAGPVVPNPRLVHTRVGAATSGFAIQEGLTGDLRWISGSVLSGKAAMGEVFGYLGRYDVQLSVLPEGREREFLAWLAPGRRKFSVIPIFLSKLFAKRACDFTTSTHGGRRAMVPIGLYERVMPMDILPTFLLRALIVGDTEHAEELGCLELDEEDLALCSFVDPGKTDFGPILRKTLEQLENEG